MKRMLTLHFEFNILSILCVVASHLPISKGNRAQLQVEAISFEIGRPESSSASSVLLQYVGGGASIKSANRESDRELPSFRIDSDGLGRL